MNFLEAEIHLEIKTISDTTAHIYEAVAPSAGTSGK